MNELLTIQASRATVSGDVRRRTDCSLPEPFSWNQEGDVTFECIEVTGVVNWLSAEIAMPDQSTDAVRIRVKNGDGDAYYFDDATETFKPVTVNDWDSQYAAPHTLGRLDEWKWDALQVVAHLQRTDEFRYPTVGDLKVLFDLPGWEGSVAQALDGIVRAIGDVRPIVIHEETLVDDTNSWALGAPYSERGFELTELVQIMVDGKHRSGTLVSGVVTTMGPTVKAGSTVKIAAKYQPGVAVRRSDDALILEKLPSWTIGDLVSDGSVSGVGQPVEVNGYTAKIAHVETDVTIRGVAGRIVDGFAMRAALQDALADGVTVDLDSGRSVTAGLVSTPQVIPAEGGGGVVEVRASIKLALTEVTGVVRTRDDGVTSTTVDLSYGIDLPSSITTADHDSVADCDSVQR